MRGDQAALQPAAGTEDAGGDLWALTETGVRKWVETARPGDELVYARGTRLLNSSGVKAVREMYDQGRVTFKQRRLGAGVTAYIAERKSDPRPPSRYQRFDYQPPAIEGDDNLPKLLMQLRRFAKADKVCPTNRELGEALGGFSADQVAYLLRKLITGKLITVETPPNGQRVVTIAASGKKTSGFR